MFKKILLKVSAFAMACTLIGTGAAYTNSTADKTGKSFGIEADAAPWVINEYGDYWTLIGVGNKVDFEYWSRTYWLPYNFNKNYSIYVYRRKAFPDDIMLIFPNLKWKFSRVRNVKINGKKVF